MRFERSNKMKHLKRTLSAVGLTVAVFALFVITALPVHATGGLYISTVYTNMTVSPGKTESFSMSVKNMGDVPQNADVSVSGLPNGWDAYFMGGGNPVSRVYVHADSTASVTLYVEVPADAKEGEYDFFVHAKAPEAEDTLHMSLNISSRSISLGMFKSNFPELRGGASATYMFNANLSNNGPEDTYYSLSAAPPEGWQVSFRPETSSQDIASLTIAADGTEKLTITVKPPSGVKAGTYSIPCTAESATGILDLDLQVMITGTYEISMATKDGRLNADVEIGKETPVTFVISNNGSADLTGLTISTVLPTGGWAVRLDQSTIDILPAGATQEIIAYISPDAKAVTGDYQATIGIGNTAQASTQVDLRVAVKTSTMWGIVAVVIIALLAVGLYFVFRKFGRR